MNIVIKSSGGHNIIIRPQGRARFYPAPTIEPVTTHVYMRKKGQPAGEAILVGKFNPGASGSIPYTRLADETIILSTKSYGPNGQPDVASLRDATEHEFDFARPSTIPGDEFDADTVYKVNGVPVVGAQQPAVPDVTASTGAAVAGAAGAAYTATEQTLINDLKAEVNTLKTAVDALKSTTNTTLSRLREGTGHGLLDT